MPTDPDKKVLHVGSHPRKATLYHGLAPLMLFPLMMGIRSFHDFLPDSVNNRLSRGKKYCSFCGNEFTPDGHNKKEVCSAECFKAKYKGIYERPILLAMSKKEELRYDQHILYCKDCSWTSEDITENWYIYQGRILCKDCGGKLIKE